MLQIDEEKRPDFSDLYEMIEEYREEEEGMDIEEHSPPIRTGKSTLDNKNYDLNSQQSSLSKDNVTAPPGMAQMGTLARRITKKVPISNPFTIKMRTDSILQFNAVNHKTT